MKICDLDKCTGCGACFNICNKDAISMKQDCKGFLRPYVDGNKCISCGLCIKTCPVNTLTSKHKTENSCYSAKNKNNTIRQQSSSGGLFTAFAEYILNKNGVVFGAAFSDDCDSVIHKLCETIEDLDELRGSKYLQSEIGNTYSQVKNILNDSRYVLFSGTPCQISGLKNYLNCDYEKLLTIDVVCHGVPSPLIYKKYKDSVKQILSSSKILKYYFRDKGTGWSSSSTKIIGDNNSVYTQKNNIDPFFATFNKELFLRDCCHKCQYNSVERVSDITLADFWGYSPSSFKMRNDEKGISLVLVNTTRGNEFFDAIKNKIIYQTEDIQMAIRGNKSLKESWPKNEKSDEFWDRVFKGEDIVSIMKSYYTPQKRESTTKIKIVSDNLKLLLPDKMKQALSHLKKKLY